MPSTDRLLTITEAARRLGVHQQTLRSWADKGLVPVVKLPSGYRRFEPAALDRVRAAMGMTGVGDDEIDTADGIEPGSDGRSDDGGPNL